MKKLLYTLAFLSMLFAYGAMHAQGENNQWCFGQQLGLNFNTSPPTFFQTNMKVLDGSSSICDASGNLIFYTSGKDTWDRNGNLMPNAHDLNGNGPTNFSWPGNCGGSISGVAIVPSPSNHNQYYILTTDYSLSSLYNAYYSVIDMTLNGGLGDVVPTQKNILLSTDISEGVITTLAPECSGYWAVMHSKDGAEYRAFKIDNNGVSLTPVVSTGLVQDLAVLRWRMHFNNGGTQIARIVDGFRPIEIANFNNITGQFSSFDTIPANTEGVANCFAFSPDDSKLYYGYSGGYDSGLVQFNISLLPDVNAVQNSRVFISHRPFLAMRVGPDNKIYLVQTYVNDQFHVINNPNVAGAGCQLVMNFMPMPTYFSLFNNLFFDLGNKVWVIKPEDTLITHSIDTVPCSEQSITLHAPANYNNYTWSTGVTTASATVYQEGFYSLQSIESCTLHIDSFNVRFKGFPLDLGSDTNICSGTPIMLNATTPNASYKWQDNSTNATFNVSEAGTYSVNVTVGACSKTDSVVVNVWQPYVKIKQPDTAICIHDTIILHTDANPQSTFLWTSGNATQDISVNTAGNYIVEAHNACGYFYDSVRIQVMDCSCNFFMPSAFSPNGDGLNDIYKCDFHCPGITAFIMKIFNRFGQCVFNGYNSDAGWDGYFNNKPAEAGTYFYVLQYKDASGRMIKKKGDVSLIR